jgi:hypothetical protein
MRYKGLRTREIYERIAAVKKKKARGSEEEQ